MAPRWLTYPNGRLSRCQRLARWNAWGASRLLTRRARAARKPARAPSPSDVNRTPIDGTERAVWPGARPVAETLNGVIWLTAWLRPRHGGELDVAKAQALGATLPSKRVYTDRSTLMQQTGADTADVDLLRNYCTARGIEIVAEHWRSIVMSAPIHTLVEAFGATAGVYE